MNQTQHGGSVRSIIKHGPGHDNPHFDPCPQWLDGVSTRRKLVSESSTDSSSSSGGNLPLPPPPDGGWGWFVVLGAFMVTVICDGTAFCFGVLYSELLVQYGASNSKTALVGSVFFGVSMILGPLASSLTTRFGCRKMTIFGGLLASAGFMASSFVKSIDMLILTFSVVVGAGFSFCYITSVVIVAFYFEKRRSLATGIAVCGSGIGTFSFAPLFDYLIKEYSLTGFFMIMSGVALNLVVCGMLFRPLTFTEEERIQLMLEEFNRMSPDKGQLVKKPRSRCQSGNSLSSCEPCVEDGKALSTLNLPSFVAENHLKVSNNLLVEAVKNSNNPHRTLHRYMKNVQMRSEQSREEKNSGKKLCTDDYIKSPNSCGKSTKSPYMKGKATQGDTYSDYDSFPSSFVEDSVFLGRSPKLTNNKLRGKDQHFKTVHINVADSKLNQPLLLDPFSNSSAKGVESSVDPVLTKKDIDHHLNVRKHKHHKADRNSMYTLESRSTGMHMGRHNALAIQLPLYRSDIFYRRLMKHGRLQCNYTTSCPNLIETAPLQQKRCCCCTKMTNFFEGIMDILRTMIDLRLFKNPFFIIFVLSNFFYYTWSDVPYMFAVNHAIVSGVDKQKASFILSVIGITNTVGQIVFGYVGDLNINLLNVYAVVSVLSGVMIGLVPFCTEYLSLVGFYGFFGFCVSVSSPLTTVLLVKYLGVDKLTSAYGLLMLIQGIANLIGPPVAGWVSDSTGNYDLSFYLSGVFHGVSGLILFLAYIPWVVLKSAPNTRRMSISVDEPEKV